jgi:hypothetical protein
MSNVVHLEHPSEFATLAGIRVPYSRCGRRGGTVQTRPASQRNQVTCRNCLRNYPFWYAEAMHCTLTQKETHNG